MHSPQIHSLIPKEIRQRCTWPDPPRWIPNSLQGKNQENPMISGQNPVLRSQCRLHLPSRPQHHYNTTNKRNRKHPKKDGSVVRFRSDTPRRKNKVQSIRNDSSDTHGCILFIWTKGSKQIRRPLFFGMDATEQTTHTPERHNLHIMHSPQIHSLVSSWSRIRGILKKYFKNTSMKHP